MIENLNLAQDIIYSITKELKPKDNNIKVNIRRNSLGWYILTITSALFESKELSEREALVNETLLPLNLTLGSFPIAKYDLLSPSEAVESKPKIIQLPLWSEILMAPEPEKNFGENVQNQSSKLVSTDPTKDYPLVITFYSFKGGVGRSTAVGMVANILATIKRRRVVIVDFDLEAPGISFMFKNNEETQTFGILDYLHQRLLTPKENIPTIEDCIKQINLPSRGELYLIQAGEYNESYIHRLADLDFRGLYNREINPVAELIDDLNNYLHPDVILVDARTGFSDAGAVALFDLAETAIICFSPTEQSLKGLNWVVQAANKQKEYKGTPDLRFLLTPIPIVDAKQRQKWISQAENWIDENWNMPIGTEVEDLYQIVDYNPKISTLDSFTEVSDDILLAYNPIADWIDAGLPDIKPINIKPNIGNKQLLLTQLLAAFQAPTAQQLKPVDIPDIFQRTDDFPTFLKDRIKLIRGAKGTGKSLLFRLFVEQAEKARQLASPYEDLRNVSFIPGHGSASLHETILTISDLESFEEQVGTEKWISFWTNYALLQLCTYKPELRSISNLDETLKGLSSRTDPRHSDIVDWLVERAKSPFSGPKANDELMYINTWLRSKNERIWLFYDELDAGFGSTQKSYSRRDRALEALFTLWLENDARLSNISTKVFLREDIWNHLNFTNTGHYSGRDLKLRWEEPDLWRLVLRSALKSPIMKDTLVSSFGKGIEQLDEFEETQLPISLQALWGIRMGDKKVYTKNWIKTRITDSQKNSFPRSLVIFLQKAIEYEKNNPSSSSNDSIIRPRALIEALRHVSGQRVEELLNEYPEFSDYLDKLKNERSPIDAYRLSELWGITGKEIENQINAMVLAGIFEKRSTDTGTPRYAVTELYLYGLGMVRKGQR